MENGGRTTEKRVGLFKIIDKIARGMRAFSPELTKILNATLHTFEGVRHRVHRDRAGEIAEVVRTILTTP